MTINFELLDKLENDRFLIFLARINQISTTWLIDNLTGGIYSHFEAQSWIKHIKSKK
jgi:regulator of sirC expression with transglutaminase-like and TPR domain